MAISKVKSIFSTYTFDDSVETKNYHRVLFRPGVSVQARELTELQTNLQRQLDYHGQFAFTDGERVTGGEVGLDVLYDYIKVESEFTDTNGTYTASEFISTIANTPGAVLTNANGVEAEVLQVISEAGVDLATGSSKTGILDSGNVSDPLTIYLKYIKGSGTTASNVFTLGETLTSSSNAAHKLMIGGGADVDNNGLSSTISEAVGQGSQITINEGVYFLNGTFVYVFADNLILDKYSNNPDNIVGLNITESVITAIDDPNLVDNAQGFPNASAPGADRYQIKTQLIKEPLNAPNTIYTNYVTLMLVENGIPKKKTAPAGKIDAALTRRLADRTYEESGNYALNPFVLDIREHYDTGTNNGYTTSATNDNKYVVGIEPNTAYIQGFRTEHKSITFKEVDKPREESTAPFDFAVKNSTTSSLPLGNYIKVKIDALSDSLGLPDINNFRELALQDTLGGAPATSALALVDTVNDANHDFTNTVSTGRTPGTYFFTDQGANVGGDCYSSTTGGSRGSGAKFKVIIDQSKNVIIEVVDGGSGYSVDNTFTIEGDALGGTDPDNNLTFDVAALGVGRARVRAVTRDSQDVLRLYLFDINMTKGDFRSVDRVEQIEGATDGGSVNIFHAKLVSPIGGVSGRKFEQEHNSYVWKLPYYGIKTAERGGQPSPIYQIQKKLYVNAATSNNTHTFSNALASDETLVSSANIIISVGSGVGAGQTDHVTDTDATATSSGQSITINHGDIASGVSVAVIVTVQKTGASSTNKKSKSFVQKTNVTYYYDGTNPLFLDAYDIYAIDSIKMGSASGADVTDKFELDNGQRTNFYDEGRLIPIHTVAAGNLVISFKHYEHGEGDYFVKDSYPDNDANAGHYLKDTPTFKLSNGEEVDLKNCVDFRPTKASVNATANTYAVDDGGSFSGDSGTSGGGSVNSPAVQPASQFIMNAEIWLGRIDKIILGRDGSYTILKGIPAENPVAKEDPADCMVIGTLKIKPFCYDARVDIIPEIRQYKRYTMKHIAEMDKRLKKLEYYTSLSLQEQSTFNISLNEKVERTATNDSTTYVDTVERFKNGIFTDQFKGHAKGHIGHPNYKCSIDRNNGVVRPMYHAQNINLVRSADDAGSTAHNRSMYTLPYTSVPFIDQPNATETEFINPYNMFVWAGTVRLSPDSDEWKDVNHLPDVIVNDDSQFDYLVELYNDLDLVGQYEWGEWETDWTGVETDIQNFAFDRVIDGDTQWRDMGGWQQPGNVSGNITTTTTTTGQSRQGTLSYIKENTVTSESGDLVVEVNYIPFIRSREVFFTAELLKPNTKLYAFFNGVNVSNYCVEKPFEEFTDRTQVVEHTNKTQHFGSNPGVLTTDASGRITGSFVVPNNRGLSFKTGERSFKLTDSPTNDTANLNDETTYAETIYRAQGLLETKQNTIVNTKAATIAHHEVADSQVITERSVSETEKVTWFDPLAQSILITEKGGVNVTELDIFLNAADSSIPINVSIREMSNGYPTQRIVPGSDTVIYPSSAASGTTDADEIEVGKRYRITQQGNLNCNFETVGATDNDPGTVFRVPLGTSQSTIDALGNTGKVDEVNTLYTGGNNSMLSDNASSACRVTFSNPIYLSQDQEYAIVLMSNSDLYKIFVTSPGKNDLTTGALVDGNHYGGSFFMSQNASTWTPDTMRDLKFKLYKAQYASSSTLKLVNDQVPVRELRDDPFLVCSNSADNIGILRVSHPNHGMMEGSRVAFNGASAVQSCTASLINTTHAISEVERDSYCITINNSAVDAMSQNVYGGGSNVTATENIFIDSFLPYMATVNLPETDIVLTYDSFTGRSQDNTDQAVFNKNSLRPLTFGKTHYLDEPICIASLPEHVNTTGNLNNTIATNKSFAINVTLSTTNPNLSPMIDGDRCSAYCISNRTNYASNAEYNDVGKGRTYIADTAPKGNSNLNAYITKEITLDNEATHLNFYADVFKPKRSDIVVYYKAQLAGNDFAFDDLPWNLLSPTIAIPENDTKFGSVEYEVDLGEVAEVTDTFSSFAFKVVFVTSNSCKPPMISNVRAIAST